MSEQIALLFPGQGSQQVGMARDLAEAYSQAQAVLAQADEILGTPLSRTIFRGPAEELDDTINTQPALLVASLACWEALRARGFEKRAAFVAGHSLGEYTALVVTGSLPFAEAARLVRERGRLMQEAGQRRPGGMAAILGLEDAAVQEICHTVNGPHPRGLSLLAVANYNSPGQVVISGERDALQQAMRLARQRGAAKAVPLAVSIAAHSPLMEPAARGLAQAIARAPIGEASIPLVANLTAEPITYPEEIRQELIQQLIGSVRWTASIQRMIAEGVNCFIEVGPGRVLSGLVKRIDGQVKVLNVSDNDSLEKTLAATGS